MLRLLFLDDGGGLAETARRVVACGGNDNDEEDANGFATSTRLGTGNESRFVVTDICELGEAPRGDGNGAKVSETGRSRSGGGSEAFLFVRGRLRMGSSAALCESTGLAGESPSHSLSSGKLSKLCTLAVLIRLPATTEDVGPADVLLC